MQDYDAPVHALPGRSVDLQVIDKKDSQKTIGRKSANRRVAGAAIAGAFTRKWIL
jgi:hypothetical protein